MQFPSGFEGVYDHLIVHASATPASLDIGADWIDRVHRQKGWSRCGYHAVIRRDGTLEWELTGHNTRRIGKPGAHVGGCGPGWNARSFGVCLIGGVKEDGKTPENNFTTDQFEALRAFIGAAVDALAIPEANVMGHRDLIKITNASPKACPCFSVHEWLNVFGTLESYDADDRRSFTPSDVAIPLRRGDKLRVNRTYTVQPGDTLWGISRVTGVTLKDIRRLNKDVDGLIFPGQRIRLLD